MEDSKRRNTKEALITAAERLFAEKGLGGVSVRDITMAAGARNQSALHYHFGDIDSLVREVFARRYRDIERTRLELLAALDVSNTAPDVQSLMHASMAPLFRNCEEKEGRMYARFCVQIVTDPRFDMVDLVRDTSMNSAVSMRKRIKRAMPKMPDRILETRLRRLFTISIMLTADYARLIEQGSAPSVEVATREAAATMAGFLTAPVPSRP